MNEDGLVVDFDFILLVRECNVDLNEIRIHAVAKLM